MVIYPLQDNIIIKLPAKGKEKTTESGIFIATSNNQQELQDQGTVIAVGQGRVLNNGTIIPSEVEVGDCVIFNKFAGTKIDSNDTGNDKDYLIIRENDILAIVK